MSSITIAPGTRPLRFVTETPCPTGLLIDGAFVAASDGATLAVEDPGTGRQIARVADAAAADYMAALEAAVAAQAGWAASAPRERSRILRRAADALRDEAESLALVLTCEKGKPLSESREEVAFAADHLEWFAEEAVRIEGRTTTSPDGQSTHLVVRTPVGPCLVVSPWNFPLAVAARVAGVRIGHGTRAGVGLGPMICDRQVERLTALVDDALARGARVVVAGGPVPGDGHFFAPVVLADVPLDARVMREEIFGPIVAIAPFDSEEEALALANDNSAGLAAYLFTSDLERAMRLGAAIEAGVVAINRGRVPCVAAPFGGVGHSGFGHSGGPEGIDEYLVTRYLTMPCGGAR